MRNSRLIAAIALAMLAFLLAGCANVGVLRKIPGPSDDLVYVGQDGNVYGVRIDRGQPYLITRDPAPSQGQSYIYLWPTISPDGQRLARAVEVRHVDSRAGDVLLFNRRPHVREALSIRRDGQRLAYMRAT